MSKPQWTDEQSAAITLRGELLVAAAAGSGKTAVLVERLIHQITDIHYPVDVDRFLVVTFTKAAANEMRERIGKALDEALFGENDPREIERLLSQRTLLQRASITTLHSFCLDLIRKHFYQLELDPGFRVADQAEADLLRQDVIEELFETNYQKEDQGFMKLVEAFGSDRDDQPLMDYVLSLYTFAYSQSQPSTWLSALKNPYQWESTEAFMQSQWGQAVCQGLLDLASESYHLLQRAEVIAQSPEGPVNYVPTLQDDLNRVGLLCHDLKVGTWPQIDAQFQSAVTFPRLPAIRSKSKQKKGPEQEFGEVDDTLSKKWQEECKRMRDEAKKKLTSLKDAVFAYPLEGQLSAFKEMSSLIQSLSSLVIEFARAYTKAKTARNILDFTDLEHYALKLLEEEGEPSLLAQGLKDYFAEVLVDEYQDINPVQERILYLVSRQEESPNLFMVGDVKQSIYRFRMADPGLFIAKYNDLPHWQPQVSQDLKKMVIDLNRNFRSRLEVIEGVNFIFRQIMTSSAGEIAYDHQAALQYGASFITGESPIPIAEGPIEVHLIDPKSIKSELGSYSDEGHGETVSIIAGEGEAENDSYRQERGSQSDTHGEGTDFEDDLSSEDLDSIRIEARLVSERIQRIIAGEEFQVIDKVTREFRPVRFSDIVILMRSYSSSAPIYVEEFQAAEIPVYAETTSGYFGASEVETMLSLLKVIDNPHLDIPLAAVLRSPFVGLNGRELGKIRMTLPEGDFYEALTLAVWAGFKTDFALEHVDELKQILGLYADSLPQRLERAQELLSDVPMLGEKLRDFWLKLQTWRTRSRRISLADLIWSLYEETGYLAYVGTLPAGVQRQANLRVFYDRAWRFEATRYRGLFRFLRFLDRFQGQGKDMGSARALGENEDVVRLISVHASKGLEFPVVFFVGLGRTFNTQNLRGRMLLHSKLGIGMPIIDIDNKVRYPSLIQYAVKQTLAQEALAEEMRILYVALTRAKERLFLYGSLDKFENTLQKWQRTAEWQEAALPEGLLRNAKCFMDWIGPALVRHPDRLFIQAGFVDSEIIYPLEDEHSRWEILFHRSLTSEKMASDGQSQESIVDQETEDHAQVEHWYSEVARRLNWQYPHLSAVRQAAKTSVSELKRQSIWYVNDEASAVPGLGNPRDLSQRPKFLQATQPLTAAERGTALHTVMQHLSFKELESLWSTLSEKEKMNYINGFLNTLKEREILTLEQKNTIHSEQIVHFLATPLGNRLFRADEILREVPFTLTFPTEDQNKILVQGVIDVVIINTDENRTIKAEILDYKTDSLRKDGEIDPEEILRDRYALQLSLYAHAIERLTKAQVTRCTLYSFTLGREIEISEQRRKDVLRPGFPFFN
ncbi:ATP-dependent exonuclase V beta subunit, helicase and exonuclease domain-containing [Desulfosporosinus orientis DSM 765]|uniref:ATP-dependent helicase/nuclease subunit A n=1 Tax=Desulfosporosinus orientis (strain ATCC 19365 / DSM 765 / NCIMB 8382 / VKM B-1628 / Singapore I) TaxID=768706 RepID=G7WDM5_DESOD|nr:UvrD-helicase domain-containing protein [Desulfosporosinus orientis]AET68350.1 ATP-dependent exonuclase V beta subunit, helicase and exonuclease domain-containing [Desulfosporosinus orientis DSM 765]